MYYKINIIKNITFYKHLLHFVWGKNSSIKNNSPTQQHIYDQYSLNGVLMLKK